VPVLPSVKDKQEQIADSLTSDLLTAQATIEAPPAVESDEELRAMYRDALREMALLRQQMAEMGRDPGVAAAGATLPGVTPAAVAASQQLEEAIQRGDEQRLRAAWEAEPHVSTYLEPDEIERLVLGRRMAKWRASGQQGPQPLFPPRRFQVNGVVLWIQVGKNVQVPVSIAELIENTRNPQMHPLNVMPAGEQQMGYWVGDNPFGV
jgi:hypothetical protein